MPVCLITGGAKSGKSDYALKLAESHSLPPTSFKDASGHLRKVTFVATAEPFDEEMTERILRHREERADWFQTVEEPLHVSAWLSADDSRVVVLDCLATLLGNWMHHRWVTDESSFSIAMGALCSAVAEHSGQVIIVTNEVGMGLVPADSESRRYRDWLGRLNAAVAAVAEEVVLLVAGVPLVVKSRSGPHGQQA
ncbi:MAG: bifunctional adenosylcobinamide kinase/adenosylcobinamide-phosphate guanylyltransferase [Alicyclobacillaceae bacterium]|nr:bifunctional adenosylcobinamide kinase/adenosylcobinamide-phosphate guanylyltransferase [Alicyclobacillaceae bacterium]